MASLFNAPVQQAISHVLFRPILPLPTTDDFAELKLNGIEYDCTLGYLLRRSAPPLSNSFRYWCVELVAAVEFGDDVSRREKRANANVDPFLDIQFPIVQMEEI